MAYKQSKGFSTVSSSGQSDLVADEHKDTLTVAGGTGVTITTNAGNDTLTISAATELSSDSSPVLGGDLDVGGKNITSSSNGHVTILPHGTGKVGINTTAPAYTLDLATASASAFRVKGATNGVDVNCSLENAGTGADDGALLALSVQADAGDPSLRFAVSGNETWSMGIDNSDGDKLKISQSSTLHTDTRLTLQGNKVGVGTSTPATTLDVAGAITVSGTTSLNGVTYTWPSSDGSSGQQLTTDASGNLSWAASGTGSGGGISNVVDDTSPQLGGDLDVNGKGLVSVSNGNIDLLPHGTGKINLDGNGSSSGLTASDGLLEMRSSTGSVAKIDMYCESSNAHKVTIAAPPHSDFSGNVNFQLPSSNGSNGQALITDGSGNTSWSTVSGGSGTLAGLSDTDISSTSAGHILVRDTADNSFDNVALSGDATLSASGALTLSTVAISKGGTGATSASAARSALGVDAAGTDNSTNVTLANTNYLTISGQEITGGTVPVGSGGTGLTSITTGNILYASGTNTIAAAAPGSTSGVQPYHSHLDKISGAGNGSDGQVLTSDGAGNIAWESVSGGSGSSESATSSYTLGYSTLNGSSSGSVSNIVTIPANKILTAITIDVTTAFQASGGSGAYHGHYFKVGDYYFIARGTYYQYGSASEGTGYWGIEKVHAIANARYDVGGSNAGVSFHWTNQSATLVQGSATIIAYYR